MSDEVAIIVNHRSIKAIVVFLLNRYSLVMFAATTLAYLLPWDTPLVRTLCLGISFQKSTDHLPEVRDTADLNNLWQLSLHSCEATMAVTCCCTLLLYSMSLGMLI